MGVREWLETHPRAAQGGASVVVIAAICTIGVQLMGNRPGVRTTLPDAYFSDDDGKTFFAASPDNVPPFDHNGKTAVSAFVYKTAAGEQFVAYLARYTTEARARIIQAKAVTAADERYGRELKKPGEKNWVSANDIKRVSQIADVKGPKGETAVEPVEPEL